MEQNEQLLFSHIQEYRRKFYVNQIMRGSLILALVMTSLFFVAILGEGLAGFSSPVRTGIMAVLGITFLTVAGTMVAWPVTKLTQLSAPLSDGEIARLVRSHFPEVDDKLINLLELRGAANPGEQSLLTAAIQKKTAELAPVPFARAINLKLNNRYLRYLAVPVALFAIVGMVQPSLLTMGGSRLFQFGREFPKPPPFLIHIENHPGELVAGQSYTLEATVDGNELPADLFLYVKKSSENEFTSYPMEKMKSADFRFSFTEVREGFTYYIGNEEVKSEVLDVSVWRRPAIRRFRVVVDYPAYTGMRNDTLAENIGDFQALKGSQVHWLLEPMGDLKEASFVGNSKVKFEKDLVPGRLHFGKTVLDEEQYYLSLLSNRNISNSDTVRYRINVQADRFPGIFVNAASQNLQADYKMALPLDFEISDDFGFSKLSLFYRYTHSSDPAKVSQEFKEVDLTVDKTQLLQHKELEIDLSNLGMNQGDAIEYYVRIWDNDFVSGPKATSSVTYQVNFPSLEEKFDEVHQKQEEIEKRMEKLAAEMNKVNEGIEKFQEKLLNQKKLNFDDKKELQKLIEKQKSVKSEVGSLQKEFEKNKEYLQNNEMLSEETLKKYEQLNEFMKDINSPELDKFLEKLQKEMEKNDTREMMKNMEDMKMSEEDIKKSIERTMELMKQLQVQQKVDELIRKLDDLKDRQDMLNEKMEESKSKEEMNQLGEKQNELTKDMEAIKKDLQELQDMKKETETPDAEQMDGLKNDAEQAEQQMQNAGSQAQQGQKKNSSESQKGASQKMQEMMDQLAGMQAGNQQQQDQQNLDDLRDLLENLLRLSFKQEDLRDEVKKLPANDPQMVKKAEDQRQLLADMEMVKDSLDELAKRVFQIEKFVTDESNKILKSMNSAQRALADKSMGQITSNQHQSMTSINNLANMLTDVMQQIQQQMQSQKPGNSSCKKPGNGKPNMQQLGEQQGKLNQQMQQMMQMGQGGKGMNPNELAKMAAQQEAIRKALQEAHEKIRQQGRGSLGDISEMMKDMEDTENELINQQLTAETLLRQQRILNKMLDSFRAVREKDQLQEERESNTGQELGKISPDQLQLDEYRNRIRQELLKSNQLEYSPDFIILIEKYFKLLEISNGN